MKNLFIDGDTFKKSNEVREFFTVTYIVQTGSTPENAALAIAIGQSIGNPNVRNTLETDKLVKEHAAKILLPITHVGSEYVITIAFPTKNIDWATDGISQLLCTIMGGQLDIDIIEKCRISEIHIPQHIVCTYFSGPKFGIDGIRKYTKVYNKPLLGGIIKPKIGMSPRELLGMVKEMVDGGINFIKEDEIMSNPSVCSIEQRVPLIMKYLKNTNVIYAVCINSDPAHILNRVRKVYRLGGNAVHVNFWSGLGVYKSIRELNLPIFLFFQKSGDKIITDIRNVFSINWNVICKLMAMSGVDILHAGMYGGYSKDDLSNLHRNIHTLHNNNVLPTLSCGFHPGLTEKITKEFGNGYMANVGGAIHGHPAGTKAGVMAMKQSIDGDYDGVEYKQAIKLWGN